MRVAETLSEFRRVRDTLSPPVGFVPTMGYLHEGHLTLVRQARASCTSVVASIFVNPTQFAPTEDLAAYPRDLERDLALLEAEGVDLVLAPSDATELYPPGACSWVVVEDLTKRLEGAARPTHFRGVATVVASLFHVVRPDRAFFGQKDAQQALVIRRMVRDLHFPVEMIVCPTVRDPDGLAMSSRNTYLSAAERAKATVLYRCLTKAQELYVAGERNAEEIRQAMVAILAAEPAARPDYVSIADPETLTELVDVDGKALVSLAVRLGKTRLIDNCVLPPGTPL